MRIHQVHDLSVLFLLCLFVGSCFFCVTFWVSLAGMAFVGGWCLFLGTLVVFVFWSCLRRVTFQRWKVTKDRRACGPGPRVGAKSAPFRFRLKPKTAFRSFAPPSPHRTRFAGLRRGPPRGGGSGGTGLANPLVATRRFSLRPQYFGHWPLGRISPLQDLVLVSLAGLVHMPPFGLPSST